MSFVVPGDAYDRFVGRFSRPLAPRFLDFAGVARGPVLEVGCGPGALTAALAERVGPGAVAAVEPSEPFAAACRARVPGADVRTGTAESLPFADGTFSAAVSQLVITFVRDPARAMAEMARVVAPGGTVAACTWESRGFDPTRIFWEAALRHDPAAPDDAGLPFRRENELRRFWSAAGLRDVETATLEVEAGYTGLDDLWEPLTSGVGPPGGWLVRQPPARQAEVRDTYHEILGRPAGPFTLRGRAVAVRGRT